jgi:8-oxo-dGTP diphosphatase
MKITEVVAALIWQGDKFMICQRPAHKARGLLWEFVGGKVEPGETKEQALIRECQEELAVTLSVGDIFMDVTHKYPDLTVHLTLFNATIAEGEPQKLEHNDIQWITPSEIHNYEFCPADEEILKKIANISRVSCAMRKALENVSIQGLLPANKDDFPSGCCGWAAESLGIALSVEYPQEYCFRVLGKKGSMSHGWIEFCGLILDITADQFGEFFGGVVMCPKHLNNFYEQWDTYSRRVNGDEYLRYREENTIYNEYVKLLEKDK